MIPLLDYFILSPIARVAEGLTCFLPLTAMFVREVQRIFCMVLGQKMDYAGEVIQNERINNRSSHRSFDGANIAHNQLAVQDGLAEFFGKHLCAYESECVCLLSIITFCGFF